MAARRFTSGMTLTPPETRASSSMRMQTSSGPPPTPPSSSGSPMPRNPWATMALWISQGNSSVSSISAARGPMTSSAKARATVRNSSCSSLNANPSPVIADIVGAASNSPHYVWRIQHASRSVDPDDQGVALAAATAQGCGTDTSATALELHRQRQHEAGAGGADGVPECHGAAVDVDLAVVDAELLGGVQGDGGEGLVDLVEVEGGGVDAELRRRLGGGVGGLGRQ